MIFSQTSTSLIRATAKQQSRVGVRNLNSNTKNAVVSESFAFYPSAGTRTFKKSNNSSNNQSFSFYPVSNGNGVAATRIQQGASSAPQKQNQVFKMQERATTSAYTKSELDALFVQSRAVAQKRPQQQQQLTSTAKESFAFYPTNATATTTTKRVVSNSESFAFYASNGATATSRKQATTQIQKTAQAESSEAASNNDNSNNKVAVALGSVFMGALVQGRRSLARA